VTDGGGHVMVQGKELQAPVTDGFQCAAEKKTQPAGGPTK